jgi:hypothetical protein
MKRLFLFLTILGGLALGYCFVACSPIDSREEWPLTPLTPEEFNNLAGSVPNKEREVVFKDTITPPNNPMNEVPYIPGTFRFRGVLGLEEFRGELYCAIRSANNNYFLMDTLYTCFLRLDDPQLKNCVVGDTVEIVAEPMKILGDLSLATYFVESKLNK